MRKGTIFSIFMYLEVFTVMFFAHILDLFCRFKINTGQGQKGSKTTLD